MTEMNKQTELRCNRCPRRCLLGSHFCGREEGKIRVSRAALHFWEEPCLSGENGAGAVFFSGCNLGCVYCQNHEISKGKNGFDITCEELANIFFDLYKQSAHNIDLVTPTHYADDILCAIDIARGMGLDIPIVWNSSGYELPDNIRKLNGYSDVFLPDFKYMDSTLSKKYSGVSDYSECAKSAVYEMVKMAGKVEFDDNGIIQKGVIVRHLVLPGCSDDSRNILRYLHEEYGDDIYISIMGQYTPNGICKYPDLSSPITSREYDRVIGYAEMLGIKNAYIQDDGSASESYTPDFDGTGVKKLIDTEK